MKSNRVVGENLSWKWVEGWPVYLAAGWENLGTTYTLQLLTQTKVVHIHGGGLLNSTGVGVM